MARPTIPDKDIPTSDPETLVYCFTPWVKKIATRYNDLLSRRPSVDLDDLIQVGSIGLLKAQRKYDPNGGANFLTYSFNHIRNEMRHELGFSSDGRLPETMISLDEPLNDDGDICLCDAIADTTPTAEERIIEQDGHDETSEAVRAAVDRLKSEKQKEVIRRVWFDGQDKQTAAEEMVINLRNLQMIDLEARHRLRRDVVLKKYAIPYFSDSLFRFRQTFTSGVEAEVIWRDEYVYGNFDLDNLSPPERTWTPAQGLAYMRRRIRLTQETAEKETAEKEATS